jgi:putative transposase
MENYRRGSHTVFDCKYHFVWVTKYRYQVLRGEPALMVREVTREVCLKHDVQILKGHVSSDHVHLHVSVPPSMAVSKLVQYIKGKSSHRLLSEFSQLKKKYWGQHVWARGYFVSTTGVVTDEVIQNYIRGHEETMHDDGFSVVGERPPRLETASAVTGTGFSRKSQL